MTKASINEKSLQKLNYGDHNLFSLPGYSILHKCIIEQIGPDHDQYSLEGKCYRWCVQMQLQ